MHRVLIIDDDEKALDLLCRYLDSDDYEVHTASDGRKGIAKASEMTFDLVITDIIMPNVEGIETLMAINKSWPNLPVIAISGGGKISPEDILQTARELGAVGCLTKPFGRGELLKVVQAALEP